MSTFLTLYLGPVVGPRDFEPAVADARAFTPDQTQRCRAAMRVPLEVWTAADAAAVLRVWGAARDVSRPPRLSAAGHQLQSRLGRQLVAWLEGRLLLSEIELTAEGRRHVGLPGASRRSAAAVAGRPPELDAAAPRGTGIPWTPTPHP